MKIVIAQASPEVIELAERISALNLANVLVAAFIIVAALMLSRLITSTLERIGEGQARRRLTVKRVQSFIRLGIFVLAGYLVVGTFLDVGEDRAALLGLGGMLAVAVGFGLKDTASSVMAGIMILMDQPFQVGDRITFGEFYGEVTEIRLRSVRLLTFDDNQVSIPNNLFLTTAVSSATAGALDMMVTMEFYIAATADFARAQQIINEACLTSRYVYLNKPVAVSIQDEMTAMGLTTRLQARAYVIDARYEKQLASDVTERVKRAFQDQEIETPYRRHATMAMPAPGSRGLAGRDEVQRDNP